MDEFILDIKKQFSDVKRIVCIGSAPIPAQHSSYWLTDQNPLEVHHSGLSFLVYLFRRFRLRGRQHTLSLIGLQDELALVELALCETFKESGLNQSSSTTKISAYHRLMMINRLRHWSTPCTNETLDGVTSRYTASLKASCLEDRAGMLTRLVTNWRNNFVDGEKPISSVVLEETVYLVVGEMSNLSTFEVIILEHLSALKATMFWTNNFGGHSPENLRHFDSLRHPGQQEHLPVSHTKDKPPSVLMDYLGVCVNLKDQLRLARIFNVPSRDLNRHAFTALKKLAAEKGLSMAQSAISYITRLRLGGSGYAPSLDHPLQRYTKPLGDLVDLISRLQGFLEEGDREPGLRALDRFFGALVRLIAPGEVQTSGDGNSSARERLNDQLKSWRTHLEPWMEGRGFADIEATPSRAVSQGSSLQGRKTTKTVRLLLDREIALINCSRNPMLSTSSSAVVRASPRTPHAYRSRMTRLFTTPDTPASPWEAEKKHKRRTKTEDLHFIDCEYETNSMPANPIFARFQSNLTWSTRDQTSGDSTSRDRSPLSSVYNRSVSYMHASINSKSTQSAEFIHDDIQEVVINKSMDHPKHPLPAAVTNSPEVPPLNKNTRPPPRGRQLFPNGKKKTITNSKKENTVAVTSLKPQQKRGEGSKKIRGKVAGSIITTPKGQCKITNFFISSN